MEIFIFWIVFSLLAGYIAGAKGRSGWGYFFLSIFLSPLVGLIAAAAMPAIKKPDPNAPSPETHTRCPDCQEFVLKGARVCKHCHAQLTPVIAPPPGEAKPPALTVCKKCGVVVQAAGGMCPQCGCPT